MTARHPEPGLVVGIDIGGTKVAGGLVDAAGVVRERARRHTPHRTTSASVVEDTIVDIVEELTQQADAPVVAVGIGAAGFVSADRSTVAFAPHLSWRNEPLRGNLEDRLPLPVTVENDANAALVAEVAHGAATGQCDAVMVNLGTGIGGAIVLDGRIHRGRFGFAGEFGHMQVVPEGIRCECGNRGCWEQYASGNALVREARILLEAGSPVVHEMQRRLGHPSELTGPFITEMAQDGDPMATELLAEIGQWLGVGMASLAAALDPGIFVIGGGVSAANELLLEPARQAFRRRLTGRGYRPEPPIVRARLGNDAGLIGAAELAREEVRS